MNASTDDARTDLSGESIAVRTRHMRSAPTEVPTAGGICAFVFLSLHLGKPFTRVLFEASSTRTPREATADSVIS